MATSAYYRWVNAGKPYKLAKPITDMRDYAKAHGIAILGTIGNGDHLTADPPEDHTPFSATAWPDPLPGYIVTAIDLADVKGLGAAILRDARAGKCRWLKYMNFGNRQYGHWDGFKNSSWNADTHIHLSIRTDHLNTSLAGYDPLGDDDMPTPQDLLNYDPNDTSKGLSNWPWRGDFKTNKTVQYKFGTWLGVDEAHRSKVAAEAALAEARAVRREQVAGFSALAAKIAGQDIGAALETALEQAAVRERAERAAERGQLVSTLAPVLVDALRSALADGVDDDALATAVEEAVRNVFGSLDEV